MTDSSVGKKARDIAAYKGQRRPVPDTTWGYEDGYFVLRNWSRGELSDQVCIGEVRISKMEASLLFPNLISEVFRWADDDEFQRAVDEAVKEETDGAAG